MTFYKLHCYINFKTFLEKKKPCQNQLPYLESASPFTSTSKILFGTSQNLNGQMVEEDIYDKLPSIKLFLENSFFFFFKGILVLCASDEYCPESQTKILKKKEITHRGEKMIRGKFSVFPLQHPQPFALYSGASSCRCLKSASFLYLQCHPMFTCCSGL